MNFKIVSFIFCLALLGQAQVRKPMTPPKGQVKCNGQIMHSYLLKGRRFSKSDKNLVCPSIKNNCCGKLDQQRMYHVVNDILPQRTVEYESKMKMALGKLKMLHTRIIKDKPVFQGNPERKLFCNQELRKLINFNFRRFYQQLLDAVEGVRSEMDNFYSNFLCVLCDGKKHKYIDTKAKKIMLNSEFCQNMLSSNKKTVKLFNVLLINYLKMLQNVVDCNHYIKSFNLKFFETSKTVLADITNKCLNNIASKNFLKHCKKTCEELQISKINYIIEGDFEFLIDAINLFEKFYEFKESGNFISMKLRMFFKKFIIPRKLDKHQQNLFLKKLKRKEGAYNMRYLKQLKDKGRKLIQMDKDNDDKINQQIDQLDHKKERKLRQLNNKKGSPKEKLTKQNNLQEGRKLAEKTPNDPNAKKGKKIKKTARLVYNKELYNFYNEISVSPPKEKKHIYKISLPPVDIDKFMKVFIKGDGVDPTIMGSRFSYPHDLFYKMLFSYRKPDAPDANLLFFLTDFSIKKKGLMVKDLDKKYVMGVKQQRILEDGV